MLCNEQMFLRPIHQIPLNISFGSNKKELLITGYAYISRDSVVAGRHKITWRRRAFRLSTRLRGMYTRRATYVDFWYKSTSRPGRAIFPAIYCLYSDVDGALFGDCPWIWRFSGMSAEMAVFENVPSGFS